jgi:hypothetical protein
MCQTSDLSRVANFGPAGFDLVEADTKEGDKDCDSANGRERSSKCRDVVVNRDHAAGSGVRASRERHSTVGRRDHDGEGHTDDDDTRHSGYQSLRGTERRKFALR